MRHLIIFTRSPQLGAVKRRLAQSIGGLAALRFHRAMQARLIHRLGNDPRWRTWIAITPDIRARNNFINQGRGDLGQRMARCFAKLPPGPALLIGSDIPDVTAAHICRAFASLGKHDLVFGPARDGGYWLAGLKRLRPMPATLFKAVRWSGPHALADTIKNAGPQKIGFADTLSDVDTPADYDHWRRLCSSSRGMISTKLQGLKR